jgi:hypothetical protein
MGWTEPWFWITLAYVFVIAISISNKKPVPEPTRVSKPPTPSSEIPKIIYTFWNSAEYPRVVECAMKTWKKWAPDYEIRVLNYENTKHMKIKHRDSHARYSDFVRLWCLAETGGFWIDATVFIQRPLDEWRQVQCDYGGYILEKQALLENSPSIESWFMCAPKGSRLIADWKHEFFRANEFDSMGDYVDDLLVTRGTDRQKIGFFGNGHYLAVYIACQFCQQNYGPYEGLNLINAEDDAMKHLMDIPLVYRWVPGSSVKNLEKYQDCRMIKIVSKDRSHVPEDFLDNVTRVE